MILGTMNLRISHYLEDKLSPGRVGAIVCFYMDRLIEVQLSHMPINERINEWNFGDPLAIGAENIIITVRYEVNKVPYFQRFRPDLRSQPCEEKFQ